MSETSKSIHLTLGFENLMSNLYGRSGHGSRAGHTDLADWKKHLCRIVGTLQSMILRSVTGDDAHRDYIVKRCDDMINAIKRSNNKDEISCLVAHFGFEISFHLVGGLPRNWQKPRTRPDLVSAPPEFRTLTYSRTAEQRSRQILDAAYCNRLENDAPDFELLISIFNSECKKNGLKFLEVIKDRYPNVYRRFEP
ncbi:MAG: hypothetical protein RLZZ505_2726 [Verrucomicrobiota bacterium]|jgi:hypothetical protein